MLEAPKRAETGERRRMKKKCDCKTPICSNSTHKSFNLGYYIDFYSDVDD